MQIILYFLHLRFFGGFETVVLAAKYLCGSCFCKKFKTAVGSRCRFNDCSVKSKPKVCALMLKIFRYLFIFSVVGWVSQVFSYTVDREPNIIESFRKKKFTLQRRLD